jgi:polyisoprenoid-binding protein YceI
MTARSPIPARAALALAVVALTGRAALAADASSWRVTRADVRVVCPMTVGGSFDAKTASLSGTLSLAGARPAILDGRLQSDLRTLDTGIALRNDHLRDKYLEVGKGEGFGAAVLSDLRLEDADGPAFRGRTRFTGMLMLHGVRKAVAGQADIRRDGNEVQVSANFPIRLDEFSIPAPRYLGVGVRNEVQARVLLVAAPAPSEGGAQ